MLLENQYLIPNDYLEFYEEVLDELILKHLLEDMIPSIAKKMTVDSIEKPELEAIEYRGTIAVLDYKEYNRLKEIEDKYSKMINT